MEDETCPCGCGMTLWAVAVEMSEALGEDPEQSYEWLRSWYFELFSEESNADS